MVFHGTVTIRYKDGVLDPQGVTIHKALGQLGHNAVQSVMSGRVFEIDVEAENQSAAQAELERISDELLANPVIENYSVEVGV